jgi:large subunit ribosomal protein L31
MKKNIHPATFIVDARCVCGVNFPILTTQEEIVVSFCSQCHPFYTNKQQFADVEGRIQKYNKKFGIKS